MGRLAVRQILRVPKYVGEMVVIRSQEQLTRSDPRSASKFGSPFELNLHGWSRFAPKPTLRELIEGPLAPFPPDENASRFGRVGSPHRLDLRRARRRAKYFTHVTTLTGGLFSNWKQVSKTVAVYRDFLHNRMAYELSQPVRLPAPPERPNNAVQEIALAQSRPGPKAKTQQAGHSRREELRLMRLHKRLRGLIDETKVLSKERFVHMNRILDLFPLL